MFVREIKKRIKSEGKIYEYLQHRLIESVRTPHGPRQHILLNLGTLQIPREQYKALADLIERFLKSAKQRDLFEADAELIALAKHFAEVIVQKRLSEAQALKGAQAEEARATELEPYFETVDINSAATSHCRTIGVEHIALSQMQELGFMKILEGQGFSRKQQQYAVAQVIGRMAHPDSERETARWLRETSGLDELLEADFSLVSDNILHRTADLLYGSKEKIEEQLSQRTRDLFSLEERLILYDLTNSYFESPKRGSRVAKYGKSKEKRRDCPLITLALVVDGQGFPKRSRIFEGNVSEPETLWRILETLDGEKEGKGPRTVIIDAGIATEENLEALRKDRRFEYVAVSRKKVSASVFAESEAKTIEMSRHKVLTVKAVRQGEELLMVCHSPEREAKDEGIFLRRRTRFEGELASMREGLSKPGTRKKIESVLERLGRIKERYKVGSLYTIEVTESEGKAVDIKWQFHKEKRKGPGEYLLRTSLTELKEEELSLLHRTLTMVESAFRWLKSELGIRPNYHQLDRRMASHVFISVLAYFFLAPILNKLQWGGNFIGNSETKEDHAPWNIPYGWRGLVRTMSSQTRVTTSLQCKDGGRITIRTTVDPSLPQENLYRRLNINPRPLSRVAVREGAPVNSTM